MTEKDMMPVIPSRNMVMFPKMVVPIYIGRSHSIGSLEHAITKDGNIIILAQKNADKELPTSRDMYKVGVVSKILQVMKLQNSNIKVLVEGLYRVKIDKISANSKSIMAEYHVIDIMKAEKSKNEMEAIHRRLVEAFLKYAQKSDKINSEIIKNTSSISDHDTLCDLICAHTYLSIDKKQKLLETPDVYAKMEALLVMVKREIAILEADTRIQDNIQKQIEKTQKDFYLNEKLKAIHKELGDDDDKKELLELEKRIAKTKLSPEARKQALSELKKLKTSSSHSPETNITKTYLECILDLPWKKFTKLNQNLNEAEETLSKNHNGLEKVKERITEHLAVGIKTKKPNGAIICFIGPPGVGKTSLGRSIADATGRKFVKISLGGMRDEAEIRGHRRTYIGAMPGKIIQAMKKAGSSNPLILLDEIDKIGMDFKGDPASALLEVLDPEQNKMFLDNYLNVEYDLSEAMFVCTANSSNIPTPLLDRLETIYLSRYTEEEKLSIASEHLVQKQMDLHGLTSDEISISNNALLDIIKYYTKEAGVRGLEKNIAKVMRKAAKKIVTGEDKTIAISDIKGVENLLGPKKILPNSINNAPTIGTANGLAYTEVGGEILHIEVAISQGKGDLKTTGKLGDVMKESIFTAISYIRSISEQLSIPYKFFLEHDIHLHVPEGAVPKDGPSAGSAICTAMISAITKNPVRNDIAMTGEITLRGKILPIGGLKEKILAAIAADITQVFIPKQNEKDLYDLPKGTENKIIITPVSSFDEIKPIVFVNKEFSASTSADSIQDIDSSLLDKSKLSSTDLEQGKTSEPDIIN